MNQQLETIAAQATPPGRGGVSIIRISGKGAVEIAKAILGKVPNPRVAENHIFKDADGSTIDLGLALFFDNPRSFTGEDVLELQGHGGPVVMDSLLNRVLSLGARIARPGEFSERAFVNGKIDLTQAEAIADLIDSASQQASRLAVRSLQGAFSKEVHDVVNALTSLRIFVEAAIDFPEEEVDFLNDERIANEIQKIIHDIDCLQATAKQGSLLKEGMQVVIAGKPNAGKSSLLNCLSGRETAIVTDIPGTTRDLLRENILIDGIPLHVIDTAGLRMSPDVVEKEGIRRAWSEIEKADQVLLVVDGEVSDETDPRKLWPEFNKDHLSNKLVTVVRNKVDKTNEKPSIRYDNNVCVISLSAKQGDGIDLLRTHLKECVGAESTTEGGFIARRRHLDAIKHAREHIVMAERQFSTDRAGELLAEDLRQAQRILGEITGEVTSDDLLGKIFSSFCIGK